MFNRRNLIQTLFATPLLSLFKTKVEAAVISEEKVPGINYPPFDKYKGIYCSGTYTKYNDYVIKGSG